jgi:DNA-binding NtrC family response regulator
MNMSEFITESKHSKKALNMATLAATLPVAVLIIGEVGVGKKTLAKVVAPDAPCYSALELQAMLSEGSVNLEEIESVIISDIDRANNIKQFIQTLEKHQIKLIATATQEKDSFIEKFAVRIDLLPLSQREEDLKLLSQSYLVEANELFCSDTKIEDIELDFSKNSISLRASIYRGVVFDAIGSEQISKLLESFLLKQMDDISEYKDLLEVFEVPLIKASRKKYKSQLQMATALNINRNTLRKKINQYNLED